MSGTACCGALLWGHLGAVFVVRMSVSGIHRLLQANTAFAREAERVGTARHDLVTGQQTAGDFDIAVVLRAELDRYFHKRVLQFVVRDVNEPAARVALDRFARHGHHAAACARNDRKLRAHARTQERLGIRDVKERTHRRRLRIRERPDVFEFSFECLVGIRRHPYVRLLSFRQGARQVFRHAGDCVHLRQVHDVH